MTESPPTPESKKPTGSSNGIFKTPHYNYYLNYNNGFIPIVLFRTRLITLKHN
jgi:hypothetical protein